MSALDQRARERILTARYYLDDEAKDEALASGYSRWPASTDVEDRDTDAILWFGSFVSRRDAVAIAWQLGLSQLIEEVVETDLQWNAPLCDYEDALLKLGHLLPNGEAAEDGPSLFTIGHNGRAVLDAEAVALA